MNSIKDAREQLNYTDVEEQGSFNFYICIIRFCAVMSLFLRQSACYWSYYALPDSLNADCASRQYPEQHQRLCIVCCSPRVDKKLMLLAAIFYMLFGGCKSLIWGLPTSVGHILLPQDRHCEPNCFHLHIFCFFSSPFSSRANRP